MSEFYLCPLQTFYIYVMVSCFSFLWDFCVCKCMCLCRHTCFLTFFLAFFLLVCLSYSTLFDFIFLLLLLLHFYFYPNQRERKGYGFGRYGKGSFGGVGEGENIIRIHYMKIIFFKLKTSTCGTINSLLFF